MRQRIEPTRAALEIAHKLLRCRRPLDELLQDRVMKAILENVARNHMRRAARFDIKKHQANDSD